LGAFGQTGQGRAEDRLPVLRGAGDLGDGDHEIEDLAEVEVGGDLAGVLGGGQQGLAGREHPGPGVEDGVGAVAVLDQADDDRALGGDVGEEAAQPGREAVAGGVALDGRGGGADLVDLVAEKGLQEFAAGGEVAVEGGLADPGAAGDLGHRRLGSGGGEGGPGRVEDPLAVAGRVSPPGGGVGLPRGRVVSHTGVLA
jgi:hypothetical protein